MAEKETNNNNGDNAVISRPPTFKAFIDVTPTPKAFIDVSTTPEGWQEKERDILKKVCDIVCEHLDMPLKGVKKNADVPFLDFLDSEGEPICDDLDYTELLMAFEEEFGFEIPEKDEKKLSTINNAVNYIVSVLLKVSVSPKDDSSIDIPGEYCAYCKFKIADGYPDAKFCPNCGKPRVTYRLPQK